MKSLLLEHPPRERLAAFRVGDLGPEELAAIEVHVRDCDGCCDSLKALPDDDLIFLLRKSLDTAAAGASREDTVPPPEGPPELAGHPRYRLRGLLGRGGMGAVYRAEHRLMERTVALKVISRTLTDQPAVVERFRQEVKAAARLSHPNVVAAHDADQAGDTHFLVMEYVEGITLAQLVQEQGPLPVERACDCIAQAARGLEHAWQHGMVHRDIKPHNLMLTPDGRLKILDFGLARFAREAGAAPAGTGLEGPGGSATASGLVLGTADYIAPEQADDAHAADVRSDLYSLGCTLYFLLTGQVPFPAASTLETLAAHRQRQPPVVTAFRKDIPATLARALERMLAKDPAHRYQTPGEVAEVLAAFAAATAAAGLRSGRRRFLWAGFLAATALVAGTVIAIRTDRGEIVIETDDENVAVLVDRAGVKVRDRAHGREYLLKVGAHDIRSGEYEIDVAEAAAGLEFSVKRFTLQRGSKVRVTARVRRRASDSAEKAELEKLQGPWLPVRAEYNGLALPPTMFAMLRSVVVTGAVIQVSRIDGVKVSVAVRVDPTSVPHRVDATARVAGKMEPVAEATGIYKLDGDTLTLCLSERKDDRPTAFVTRPLSGHRLIVFRRVREPRLRE